MLVLSRKQSEKLVIGDNIVVTVVAIGGNRVRLAIDAPADVPIHRSEVREAIRADEESQRAASRLSAREQTDRPARAAAAERPLARIRRRPSHGPAPVAAPDSLPGHVAATIDG